MEAAHSMIIPQVAEPWPRDIKGDDTALFSLARCRTANGKPHLLQLEPGGIAVTLAFASGGGGVAVAVRGGNVVVIVRVSFTFALASLYLLLTLSLGI